MSLSRCLVASLVNKNWGSWGFSLSFYSKVMAFTDLTCICVAQIRLQLDMVTLSRQIDLRSKPKNIWEGNVMSCNLYIFLWEGCVWRVAFNSDILLHSAGCPARFSFEYQELIEGELRATWPWHHHLGANSVTLTKPSHHSIQITVTCWQATSLQEYGSFCYYCGKINTIWNFPF